MVNIVFLSLTLKNLVSLNQLGARTDEALKPLVVMHAPLEAWTDLMP